MSHSVVLHLCMSLVNDEDLQTVCLDLRSSSNSAIACMASSGSYEFKYISVTTMGSSYRLWTHTTYGTITIQKH
jgi:hypothetical protein